MEIPHYTKLAEVLTGFSTSLNAGERVLIDAYDVPEQMVVALVRAARKRDAIPFVQLNRGVIHREMLRAGTRDQFEETAAFELIRMQRMDAYIALRGSNNIFEVDDVPVEHMLTAVGAMKPVQDCRVNSTKWVVLRWPNPAMAQLAQMSTEAFEDFFFKVCTLDYSRMKPGMEALKELMNKTDEVRIQGPDTDLRFSIKGINTIASGGLHNIPDGEVFTAPVRDSVNGVITYNAPSVYQGTAFDNIKLRFENGRIVEATSSNTERLNEILNQDDGARYIGEFAIGFNPHILEPMRDILFDEKIAGSFHFTPGQAYEDADNGNRSQVHWDMVCIQRPEYGGGTISFDGEIIRRDGMFVKEDLLSLNPDNFIWRN
mgnify:CR=1 FL=1|tara:strand:+ start:1362 stop:2480 length:1119 start_codon:yes stop_codon:yes gene_type:complete